jgi:hypothetical protein
VIEADETGAASLLLDPAITVNSTPYLTVKMTAKQVGTAASVSGTDSYWHRFAMPVEEITTLPRTPNVTTYFKYWDYNASAEGEWADVVSLADLKPFVGYCLTLTASRQDVVYTFQGNLAGNQNNPLEFQAGLQFLRKQLHRLYQP